MVIGGKKLQQIKREPLLDWYFDLFREVLERKNQKILIIGYGFADEHINKVIRHAVEDQNLRIFIVSPQDHSNFMKAMDDKPFGKELTQGIEQYYHNDLAQIFPPDQSVSIYYKNLRKDFFGLNIR